MRRVTCPTSLNAPFGAQCFPTEKVADNDLKVRVSMHLLVLSAFRRTIGWAYRQIGLVSMHLLVLSAFRPNLAYNNNSASMVSMHLLVLSAFRP